MNRNIEVMTSSKTMDWITPQEFVDALPFDFDVDVCATEKTAKCLLWISPEDDALTMSWGVGICWMNPPYGRNIEQWITKAQEESERGAIVVCLVPNRTETQWFHRIWAQASLICFVGRRIKFQHPDPKKAANGAPFGSVLAVFGRLPNQAVAESCAEELSRIGAVLLPGYGNLWLHAEKE